MIATRDFTLGQVLSVTTEKLCCDIGGLYEILNYMTRDNLFTHQLPRVCRECKPWLLRQYPQLADVDASTVNRETIVTWMAEQEARFGKTLAIQPIPQDDHTRRDPIAEAVEVFGKDRVVVVEQPEAE